MKGGIASSTCGVRKKKKKLAPEISKEATETTIGIVAIAQPLLPDDVRVVLFSDTGFSPRYACPYNKEEV